MKNLIAYLRTRTSQRLLNIGFGLSLLLLLFLRVFIFLEYNLRYIDSDQPFMWAGASDYAKGLFYEPRYYGQNYNTFMEALFAVPLTWMKVPVYYAVPAATQFLSLFPILFTAFYLFFKQKKAQAIVVVILFLCFPIEYDVLNGLPRGFVTGLFFTSFFIISILNPRNQAALAVNTLLSVTGYFINQNSVVVSVPFLFYLFLQNYKNPRYYLVSALCLSTALPLHLLFDRFYTMHPEYVVNSIYYRMSSTFFVENISHLDLRFAHVSFFTRNNCLPLLASLAVFGALLYHSNKKAFSAFCVFILVILFSFCTGKTMEGSLWVYMSFSRMYLGIPLFMALFLSTLTFDLKKFHTALLLIPFLFTAQKLVRHETLMAYHYDEGKWVGVRLFSLEETLHVISFYKEVCRKNNSDLLLVSNKFWLHNYISYGGPATDPQFPETQETRYDKRYWVRAKNNDRILKSLVFISSFPDLDKLIPRQNYFQLQRIDDYGLFLVKNNTLKTKDLITFINAYEPG